MDYKKIIKSRETRQAIAQALFRFIPDKWLLELQYWIKFDKKLHLSPPPFVQRKAAVAEAL